MVKQYPHYLFVHVVADSVQDPVSGNWSDPVDRWDFHSICREETNGRASQINGPDGKAIIFSSTVYMPRSAERIAEGTEVLVSETKDVAGQLRVKGQVLKFDPGQMNRRVWV